MTTPTTASAWMRAVVCLAALAVTGCGYSATTKEARTALDQGRPQAALSEYNELLEVDSETAPIPSVKGDKSLYVLDRSMVLQQLEKYDLSAKDLQVADKQVEVLDFSRGTADDIGRYLYSDDTGPYKAPAYEKVLINTMNMVNYLARDDLNGARIEARRLAVMQKFITDREPRNHALIGPGSYLAGFAFEKSGYLDEAMRFYEDALEQGVDPSLVPAIIRAAAKAGYQSARLDQAAKSMGPSIAQFAPLPPDQGEVLLVMSYGRVPVKKALRIPIGLALTYAAGGISPQNAARANEFAAQGLVTWINFPTMKKPPADYGTPYIVVDGKRVAPAQDFAVDQAAVAAWLRARGAVVASAITRMITRVVAGIATGEAAKAATKNKLVGFLFSLGTQATLSALDTPDTRSWGTLPARVMVVRLALPAGKHTFQLSARGTTVTRAIDLPAGGAKVVSFTELR